jgi:hypothetical protein
MGPHEARLAAARQAQASPAWRADYKVTRSKMERRSAISCAAVAGAAAGGSRSRHRPAATDHLTPKPKTHRSRTRSTRREQAGPLTPTRDTDTEHKDQHLCPRPQTRDT